MTDFTECYERLEEEIKATESLISEGDTTNLTMTGYLENLKWLRGDLSK